MSNRVVTVDDHEWHRHAGTELDPEKINRLPSSLPLLRANVRAAGVESQIDVTVDDTAAAGSHQRVGERLQASRAPTRFCWFNGCLRAPGGPSVSPFAEDIERDRQTGDRPKSLPSRRSPYSLQKTQDAHLQVFHGASRTRTGDLLGAIQAIGSGQTRVAERSEPDRLECRNISRNILRPTVTPHDRCYSKMLRSSASRKARGLRTGKRSASPRRC
jgi:hypothetical protein